MCLPACDIVHQERERASSAHQDATHQDLLHYSPTSPTQQSTTGWKERAKGVLCAMGRMGVCSFCVPYNTVKYNISGLTILELLDVAQLFL